MSFGDLLLGWLDGCKGGGGGNRHYKGTYRRVAGMGYTFRVIQYINGYHFHFKVYQLGIFFYSKRI